MPVSQENVQKPLRKLRKSMKKFSEDASVEDVHKLRTQTRRMEAIAAGLMLNRKHGAHRLFKSVKPLRKAAGDVRDMDVLEAKAMTLSSDGASDSLVRLVEHLGEMRGKGSRDLYDQVAERRKDVRQRLKKFSKQAASKLEDGKHGPAAADGVPDVDPVAVALRLAEELSQWPKLTSKNIHSFRIKSKQLRYLLQLAEDSDTAFVHMLGDVKDTVGDWHDWLELSEIAANVLDREVDGALLKQIEAIERVKLKKALSVANRLRKSFLCSETGRNRGKRPPELSRKVLNAAAKLSG